MSRLGNVQPGYLSSLVASAPKTLNGLADMRGYDWSAAPHDRKGRANCYENYVTKVDFSNSKAADGFTVQAATFEECTFDRSVWSVMVFIRCRFLKCSFDHCRLYHCRFNGSFRDCSFDNLSARGEHFSFGYGSEYLRCSFGSVELRNVGDQVGVRFEDCRISGVITNGVFHGRRYALKERFSSVPDLLFSKYYRSVAFIRCDLSGLKTENVVFEKDIIFKDNKVGSQTMFTQ